MARPMDASPSLPAWGNELSETYLAGNISTFVLHGNVDDLQRVRRVDGAIEYVPLKLFLAEQLFGRWDVVLQYDLSRPPRALAGRSPERLQAIGGEIDRHLGPLESLPREPKAVFALLDRYLERILVARREKGPPKVALILDYAQLLFPNTSLGHAASQLGATLITVLNWARSPYLKQVNFALVLISEKLAELQPALVHSAHTKPIEVPYPTEEDRHAFIEWMGASEDLSALTAMPAPELASLTAGLTLVNIRGLLLSAKGGGQPLALDTLKAHKKELIEGACHGLVEFIEPGHTLQMVVGHEAAKRRLKEDARLMEDNHLGAVPMGYLLSGPVGTGKSFLAQCYAGTVGIPCLKLLNFRSKYVGETEGNLEKILKVLRVMGPVVVMIDEADAALGDRDQQGDSGTSSRVFASIAAQMGDTRYRGRIIWFLMTARPDLLPIDIKRQGRAEVHVALFYPSGEEELRQMFVVMGRKNGIVLAAPGIPPCEESSLSGADVEGIVMRAWRRALIDGRREVTRADLTQAVEGFIPSSNVAEKRMQELAAIIECTESEMLPPRVRKAVKTAEGRAAIMLEFEQLRAQLSQK